MGARGVRERIEEGVEQALNDLRQGYANSPDKKKRAVSKINSSLRWLKEEYPDSYILSDGFDLSY
jgi:hypothetical protein